MCTDDLADFTLGRLFSDSQALRREYLNARPWPHVVIEGAFPDRYLDAVAEEIAAIDLAHLITSNHDRSVKQETSGHLGPVTERLLEFVDGAGFRDFISQVTGVQDLLSDLTHRHAGAHRTPPGGFTKIHRDFEVHPVSGLFHRVNLLVYLNRDWPDSFGGSLELWPSDMSSIGRRIFPRFNTMILWETHGATLHGLPDPVSCPSDRMRLSVASYYYTREPRTAPPNQRSLVGYWAARPAEDHPSVGRMCWQDYLRAAMPGPVRNFARTARRRVVKWRENRPKLIAAQRPDSTAKGVE